MCLLAWLALQESSKLYLFPLVLTGTDRDKKKKKMEMAEFPLYSVFCTLWVGGTQKGAYFDRLTHVYSRQLNLDYAKKILF
jgi:hypothetical protein